MPQQVTCPGCGVTLRVPDQPSGPLSCPRCLTRLPLTGTGVRTSAEGVSETPGPGAWSPPEDVSVPQHAGVDREAHLVSRISLGVVAGLMLLCVVGVVLILISPKPSGFLGRLGPLMVVFAILDVLAMIWIGIWLGAKWSKHPTRTVGQTLVKVLLGLLLFAGVSAAALVFFFFVCLGLANVAGG